MIIIVLPIIEIDNSRILDIAESHKFAKIQTRKNYQIYSIYLS